MKDYLKLQPLKMWISFIKLIVEKSFGAKKFWTVECSSEVC